MRLLRAAIALSLLALVAWPLSGQEHRERVEPDSARPRRGSEFLIPASSFLLPGLGQYIHRAPAAGAAYTATALVGIKLSTLGEVSDEEDLPRKGNDQLAEQGLHLVGTSMFLSSWDAFHRAIPRLQGQGKYEFLRRRESVGQLVSAPFDYRFLRRWTTWIDLTQATVLTALILSERKRGEEYVPFRARDGAYAASISMNAAVGEEALFRGYLLPLFHQQTGRRFWLANGMQAGIFGAAHLPDAEWFALVIGGWALWEGWLVRRNDWSIRESIFHHFWYDATVITATLLTDKARKVYRITLPAISF